MLERSGRAILVGMPKKPKLPGDPNQLARLIVEQEGRGARYEPLTDELLRSQMAKLLGQRGGLTGGPARAAVLTSKRRTEIAKKAAASRWEGKRKKRR